MWRLTLTVAAGRAAASICRTRRIGSACRVARIVQDELKVKEPAANELTYIDQLPALTGPWPPPKSTCERKKESAREREFSIPNPCTW